MADVNIIPKVRCDNCGHIEEKHKGQYDKAYSRPRTWGSCRMEGSRATDSYGSKSRLDFTDLCPKCAKPPMPLPMFEGTARRREAHGLPKLEKARRLHICSVCSTERQARLKFRRHPTGGT